jgi:hypothetical protein
VAPCINIEIECDELAFSQAAALQSTEMLPACSAAWRAFIVARLCADGLLAAFDAMSCFLGPAACRLLCQLLDQDRVPDMS